MAIQYEEMIILSNIKPVSALRNYNEVLKSCQPESPVFLTKNGGGKYVLMEIHDYEKLQGTLKLLAKLEEGEKVAREEGWLSIDDISATLGL
jgi:prevent-host-death family protein